MLSLVNGLGFRESLGLTHAGIAIAAAPAIGTAGGARLGAIASAKATRKVVSVSSIFEVRLYSFSIASSYF